MAFQSIWYYTNLPKDVVDIIEKDLSDRFDNHMEDSKLHGDSINRDIRNSHNVWIPTTHWVSGFIWHYVEKANRENFLYDLRNIDQETLQYTRYTEGQYYNWHNDASLPIMFKPEFTGGNPEKIHSDFINKNCELIRKLSFVLQLSDPDDYEGGNLQLLDEQGSPYVAPRQRGTMILFDSRTQHRVLKVTKGTRKSLVGWTVGPRWK